MSNVDGNWSNSTRPSVLGLVLGEYEGDAIGEFEGDTLGDVVGDGAYRLMSQFIKRMAPVLSVNDCILIGIQHMIANTRARPGQKSKGRSGGRKIRYAVDVDLECRYISPWTDIPFAPCTPLANRSPARRARLAKRAPKPST